MINKNIFDNKLLISLQGENINKFLNMMIYNNITVSIIKRENEFLMIKINLNDFKRIVKIAKRNNLHFHIEEKTGIYFVLREVSLFKTFVILLCFFMFYFCSLFITKICILKSDDALNTKIIQKLNDYGIMPFALKDKIYKVNISKKLVLDINQIIWADIWLDGCVLYVDYEKRQTYDYQDKTGKIIAKNDGIIKKILVRSGTSLVKEGDTVVRGQVLVDDKVFTREGKEYKEEADADIIAITYYKISGSYDVKSHKKIYNKRRYVPFVSFNKKEFIPKFLIAKGQKYDKIIMKRFKFFNISFGIYRMDYYLLVENNTSLEKLIDMLSDNCDELFLKKIQNARILDVLTYKTRINVEKDNQKRVKRVTCIKTYECYENIAMRIN